MPIANGSSYGLFFDNCGTSQNGTTVPYGVPVTFDNIAGIIEECEIYNEPPRDCLYGVGASSDATSGAMMITSNMMHFANSLTNAVVAVTYDPGNTNLTLPDFRVISNLAENQTANSWTKVTNNFRSTLTTPVSPSDGCELAPVF